MKRWISMLALFCSLSMIGCGAEEPDTTDDAPSKQELAEQLASGKADSMTDWCAVFDWYDDGICDDFCALPDGDCDTGDGYDPCGGLACGEECSVCDPSDPNCFETAVIKMCQADGSCTASVATCGGDDDNNGGAYDPCGGLACGELCTICDPTDPDCAETSVIKMCQADGSCSASVATCDDDDFDPCEGLACGESCSLCAPNDTECYETADLKFCQADGVCSGVEPQTCDPDDTYDPCGGKVCGDSCTLCDPADADCFETAVVKLCTSEGVCSANAAVCM